MVYSSDLKYGIMEQMLFTNIVGHQKQKELFTRLIEKGNLMHGYAFVGPDHVGKTAFAVELARHLGARPALDLIVWDEERGMGIDESRSLRRSLSLAALGSHKVGIIARAQDMSIPAANTLLKLLEEAPRHSILILIAANFDNLLPTVGSRLQRVVFSLLTDEEIRQGLASEDLAEEKLEEILELADGRFGLARRLMENPRLFDFYVKAKTDFRILESGSVLERLKTSQELASLSDNEQERWLKFASRRFARQGILNFNLAHKLLSAFHGFKVNLNTKLLFDDLFLT